MDILASIITGIRLAIQAAPQAVDILKKAKAFITSLFSAGLITKEEQQRAHDHLDALQAAALAGEVPPHWQVDPDPS